MDTKVALIGIIVNSRENADKLNDVLHEYGDYIIGRMGIPYQQKEVSIISIVIDAPQAIIDQLSGKLGEVPGVSTKTIFAKP